MFLHRMDQSSAQLLRFFKQYPGLARFVGGLLCYYNPDPSCSDLDAPANDSLPPNCCSLM